MRRFVAVATVLMLAGPILAQSAADPAEPKPTVAKMKRVCKPTAGTNPLFPEMKCRMVPVAETASAASSTEVAMRNSSAPR